MAHTTSTARPTLAQLNARMASTARPSRFGFDTLRVATVGRSGRRNSGSHTHLMYVERIVSIDADYKGRKVTVGNNHGAYTPCNGNGQFTGTETGGETSDITCKACLKMLARIEAAIAAEAPAVVLPLGHTFTPWKTVPTRCNDCGKVAKRHAVAS